MRRSELIAAVVGINALLGSLAISHWGELKRIVISSRMSDERLGDDQQNEIIAELEQQATQARHGGSYQLYEDFRREKVFHAQTHGLKPSWGVSLYFLPETLPAQSLERSFAEKILSPGVAALEQSFEQGQAQASHSAYRVLESRVVNYEGGASMTPDGVSPEAQAFLRVYRNFDLTAKAAAVQEKRVPASK